ncbi:hypothetical protein B0T26DRAFT_720367, partial [Lasiosphaeria miniovina]
MLKCCWHLATLLTSSTLERMRASSCMGLVPRVVFTFCEPLGYPLSLRDGDEMLARLCHAQRVGRKPANAVAEHGDRRALPHTSAAAIIMRDEV